MVSHSFNNRDASAVTHAKALSCPARGIEESTGGTIHHGVADDRILVGLELCTFAWANDDLPSTHSLGYVIVGLTIEAKAQTTDGESPEALARSTLKVTLDRSRR